MHFIASTWREIVLIFAQYPSKKKEGAKEAFGSFGYG
jgi:hypothetical protein